MVFLWRYVSAKISVVSSPDWCLKAAALIFGGKRSISVTKAQIMAEVWRGEFLESLHRGHAVICDASGEIVASWGDADKIILPRSSCKMLQALPLVESGAAAAYGLTGAHLALACASHHGAEIHTSRVSSWLADLGLGETDLRCGPQEPADRQARMGLYAAHRPHDQVHNNCSGKHSGFLTLAKHLRAGPEYVEPTHPVQLAVRSAFEEMTQEVSPGFAIDGCSAPNFATSLRGLARAMARMAGPGSDLGRVRAGAAVRLVKSMAAHPDLVAGSGCACTELMQAMGNGSVVKTGAEGVFVAILPERGFGVALKVEDGNSRGSKCAMAALLVRLGVAEADHPLVRKRLNPPQTNRAGILTGKIRPADGLFAGGKPI
jgi:L-asparaginase II